MSTDFGMFADPEPKVYEPDPEPEEIQDPFRIMDNELDAFAMSLRFSSGIGVGKSHFAGMMRVMDKMKQSFRGVRPDMVCFDDLEAQIDLGKYFLVDSISGVRAVPALDTRVKLSQEAKIEHKSRMGDAKQKGPKGHKRWGNGQHNAGRKGR